MLEYFTALFKRHSYVKMLAVRCAIAYILEFNTTNVLNSPFVTRLFKGFFHVNPPPLPRCTTWDPHRVLPIFRKWPKTQKLSLSQLSAKTAFLLAISTGCRIGELSHCHLDYIQEDRHEWIFEFRRLSKNYTTTNSDPNLMRLIVPANTLEPELCPITTLKAYIDRTAKFRATRFIFVSQIPPHKGLSVQRISSLIRWILVEAGVVKKKVMKSGPQPSVQKVRSVVSSTLFNAGVPLQRILSTCRWSTSQAFAKHYYKRSSRISTIQYAKKLKQLRSRKPVRRDHAPPERIAILNEFSSTHPPTSSPKGADPVLDVSLASTVPAVDPTAPTPVYPPTPVYAPTPGYLPDEASLQPVSTSPSGPQTQVMDLSLISDIAVTQADPYYHIQPLFPQNVPDSCYLEKESSDLVIRPPSETVTMLADFPHPMIVMQLEALIHFTPPLESKRKAFGKHRRLSLTVHASCSRSLRKPRRFPRFIYCRTKVPSIVVRKPGNYPLPPKGVAPSICQPLTKKPKTARKVVKAPVPSVTASVTQSVTTVQLSPQCFARASGWIQRYGFIPNPITKNLPFISICKPDKSLIMSQQSHVWLISIRTLTMDLVEQFLEFQVQTDTPLKFQVLPTGLDVVTLFNLLHMPLIHSFNKFHSSYPRVGNWFIMIITSL